MLNYALILFLDVEKALIFGNNETKLTVNLSLTHTNHNDVFSQPLNMSMMLFFSLHHLLVIMHFYRGFYFAGHAFKLSPARTVSLSEHEAEETNPSFHMGMYLSEQ